MNYTNQKKIKIYDVAEQTGMSAPLIRKLMRDGVLNIGICVKHGNKYYYYIIEKNLRDVFGDEVTNKIINESSESSNEN